MFGLCLGSGPVSAVICIYLFILFDMGRYIYLTGGCVFLPYAANSFVEILFIRIYNFDRILFYFVGPLFSVNFVLLEPSL